MRVSGSDAGTLLTSFASIVLLIVLLTAAPAAACEGPPPVGGCRRACGVELGGCKDGSGGSDGAGPQGPGGPGRPGEPDPNPARYTYKATCGGAFAGEPGDGLCGAATQTCPAPGDTRFWVYISTWSARSPEGYGPPTRRLEPPYDCLGPAQAAAVDPRIAVAAQVRADWRTFGLPAAQVDSEPEGETLAGVATRLSTSTPGAATLPPKPVLGMGVTLTVTAVRYEWQFGDGTSTSLVAPAGTRPRTEHVYTVRGPVEVSLRTFYTATFTIEGSPEIYPLQGEADVPGEPTALVVREARTQLVDG